MATFLRRPAATMLKLRHRLSTPLRSWRRSITGKYEKSTPQWKFEEAQMRSSESRLWKQLMKAAGAGAIALLGFYTASKYLDLDDSRILFLFDAETAHNIAVNVGAASQPFRMLLGMWETHEMRVESDTMLATEFCGMSVKNCIGLAAGFDKNAQCMVGMLDLGFGFVEAGTVTPLPQAGNPKPRVFRLVEQKAVINRYGFNSEGHDAVAKRCEALEEYYELFRPRRIVGINIGKNKTSPDHIGDYVNGIKKLGKYADYLVVNVSSPNTPGLRNLQGEKELRELLTAVMEARNQLPKRPPFDYKDRRKKRRDAWVWSIQYQLGFFPSEEYYGNDDAKRPELPPLLVKIAPDVTHETLEGIAQVVKETKIDGIIISNTTIRRDFGFEHEHLNEAGGLSGAPVKDMSTKVIKDFYRLTEGKVPIIGVGGVSSGQDAYEKIKAGASLVQLYTGFIYGGTGLVSKIKKELSEALATDGFKSVQEAVGLDHKAGMSSELKGETGTKASPWYYFGLA
mmetsp:Transcript_9217/g.22641  ORF Transcript_9217/g.22641 Transcript_9217/m.22641 type:complete len:511 (-) Transcript_9217:189-1721(-)